MLRRNRISKQSQRRVPELNTSALPDLIFTVLFFFMIVTHMRQTDVKVKVETPEGTELQKMNKKYAVSYVYVGKDKKGDVVVQLNNDIIPLNSLAEAIREERNMLPLEDQQYHTVSIKVDRNVPVGVVADVKDELRSARALQISYSATEINKKP